MPRLAKAQSSLTSGEQDPLLHAREDLKHYYNGAEYIRNVLVIPQGGGIRRPGLRYIDELQPTLEQLDLTATGITVTAPNGGTAANATDDDTTTEVTTAGGASTTNPFVIVHVDLGSAMSVLFCDVEGLRLSSGATASSGEVVWQYSDDNSAWTTIGTAFDTIDSEDRHKRRTPNSSHRYWRLARVGSTDLSTDNFVLDEIRFWQSTATLSNARLVPHKFSETQRYLHVFTDRNVAVYKNGVLQVNVPSPYTSADLKTVDSETDHITSINWTQELDVLLVVHEDYAPRNFFRDGADDEWNPKLWPINTYPSHNFEFVTTTTITPAAATGSSVNFTSSAAMFVSGDVGKFIRYGTEGYAVITSYFSSTVVVCTILTDFPDTSAIPAGEWTFEEQVWSSTRGWPLSAIFYQGRLYFAGSKGRPSTVWGSKAGNYNNFSIGDASAADAIDVTANTDDVVTFTHIRAERHLSFFSTSAEFYVPISEDTGLTPANFVLRKTTDRGAKRGLRTMPVDGAILFIQRQGKALREFIYAGDIEFAYQANNISLLSSHLVSNPFDIDIRRSTSTSEADYVLIVNNDGTLATFCTLRDQNINAFSLQHTDGDFLNVGVDLTEMYFHVSRTINGTERRFLEVFDDDLRVDCGVKGTGVASSATAAHLVGETVDVILDDSIQPQETVATGGGVTFDRDSATDYQVGLPWPDVQEAEVTRLQADGYTEAQSRRLVYGNPTATALGVQGWIRDMPVGAELPDGTVIGRKKRVPSVTAQVRKTTGMSINNNPIAFQQFGSELLDQAIPEFTGNKTEDGLLGWDEFGQVDITFDNAYKFQLLGIAKRVAV